MAFRASGKCAAVVVIGGRGTADNAKQHVELEGSNRPESVACKNITTSHAHWRENMDGTRLNMMMLFQVVVVVQWNRGKMQLEKAEMMLAS
jgi:hypothetical protein